MYDYPVFPFDFRKQVKLAVIKDIETECKRTLHQKKTISRARNPTDRLSSAPREDNGLA